MSSRFVFFVFAFLMIVKGLWMHLLKLWYERWLSPLVHLSGFVRPLVCFSRLRRLPTASTLSKSEPWSGGRVGKDTWKETVCIKPGPSLEIFGLLICMFWESAN